MNGLEGLGARLRLLFRRRAAEARMTKEIDFHIEMETLRLTREQGLDSVEARRRALVAFGGVEKHKEELRDGRGRAWFDSFSLDLKLGGRMLVKYPGLTIVGGLAMAFGILVGTIIFAVVTMLVYPSLPLPGGERIVEIRNWDVAANRSEPRALHDFLVWRDSLRSITQLGAWRDVTRNLIVAHGETRPVQIAEMTASGFRVSQGEPLLGRVFTADDEKAGAPPVAVLGYEVWQARFGADSGVVGRTVQVGTDHVTVIGVMREGFGFPVSHDLWMPLRIEALNAPARSGPAVTVFGVLAPGATLETAQAELTTLGRREAGERPATHEHLQPRVRSYAKLFLGDPKPADLIILASINFFAVMLLVLICSNVALLMFARAATREGELVVRNALGASRGRIIAQLFAEALALGGVAAGIGLLASHFLLRIWGVAFLENNFGRLPFWYDLRLSVTSVLFALGLTLFGSAIAGVLPALKVTGAMASRLKQATAGARGLQFGGVWTLVIVAQVAITVAFPAILYVEQWQLRHVQTYPAGFAAREYLAVRIDTDNPVAPEPATQSADLAQRAALATTLETLRRRVEAEPGVAGVTFADRLPRTFHPDPRVELNADRASLSAGAAAPDSRPPLRTVHIAGIDPSYFDVLEAPILRGRAFTAGECTPGAKVAIVDQGFVDQVLDGRNAIGQRVRLAGGDAGNDSDSWIEIVGVVKDLGMASPLQQGRPAGLYVPVPAAYMNAVHMVVHLRGDPMLFAPRLREIGFAVAPTLRLSEFQRVDEVTKEALWQITLWLRVSALMTAIALLLSFAGIYAVLSFTVARRTREIGVRVALGASRRRVVAAIFRRPLAQVGLGVLAGAALIASVASVAYTTDLPGAETLSPGLTLGQVAMLLAYTTVMFAVCLLACVVPTRRALRVEPTVALRVD